MIRLNWNWIFTMDIKYFQRVLFTYCDKKISQWKINFKQFSSNFFISKEFGLNWSIIITCGYSRAIYFSDTKITATKGDLHRATVELRQVRETKENSWHLNFRRWGTGTGGYCEDGGRIPVGVVGPGDNTELTV